MRTCELLFAPWGVAASLLTDAILGHTLTGHPRTVAASSERL
jgi:hypothetical protein